jgi:D-alanyl-D-alanine carboxypeptidase
VSFRVASPHRGSPRAASVLLPVLLALVLVVALAPGAWAQSGSRYAAIVIDAATGEVFHQHNADRQLYPASLTKMMTLYMTFRALDEGRLTLNQRLPVSRHADSQPPSHLALPAGSSIRVEDAIYALVTKSANDVAAVLAEALGGTESGFAELMTREARELGMASTTFRNASGLPDNRQQSTARDMARLSQALIWNFPEYYRYFSTRNWSYNGVAYRNHNRLLGDYDGMDGLKTGYIRASGFNLAASAVRGNLRLIAVMFGGDTARQRNQRVAQLLDNGFASARGRQLIASGTVPFVAPVPPRSPALGPLPELPEVALATAPPPLWAAAMPLPPRRPGGTVVVADGPAGMTLEEGSGDATAEAVRAEAARSEAQGDAPARPQVAALLAPRPAADGPMPVVPVPPRRAVAGEAGAGADRNGADDDPIGALAASVASAGSAPPAAPVAGWSIQVGAYPDRGTGEGATRDAAAQLPDLLADATPRVIEVATGEGALYRARLTGLDATTASTACASLTALGTTCVTIAPGL